MAETGDYVPLYAGQIPSAGPPYTLQLNRVTDYLQEMTRIGTFYDDRHRRRYVDLKKQEIFDSLVDLYTQAFHTHWDKLERLVKAHPPPQAYVDQPIRYIAANYISAWMYDLYVSNRHACRKISDVAYSEHYILDLVHMSTSYDVFLVALSEQIRPTCIKFSHEDTTLFIPRISCRVTREAAEENLFGIRGWSLNYGVLQGLVFNLRKLFHMEALSEKALGRPAWLLDWQTDGLVYAWFPSQGNYSLEDVAIAYILGVACSPELAIRDYDEWQMLPGNVIPDDANSISIRRIRPLTYHGSIEYRTIETRVWSLPASYLRAITDNNGLEADAGTQAQKGGQAGTRQCKKKARTVQQKTTREQEVESLPTPAARNTQAQAGIIFSNFKEARVVDYLYHAQVVRKCDLSTRQAAHWKLIYSDK